MSIESALNNVYLGKEGSGEAQVLPRSSYDPVETVRYAMQNNQRRNYADDTLGQKGVSQLDKLLEDPKAKWDVDAINSINPRLEAFRNKAREVYRKYNYRPPPQVQVELDYEGKKIAETTALSNGQFDQWKTSADRFKAAKPGAFDPQSEVNVMAYRSPRSFLGKQVLGPDGELVKVDDLVNKATDDDGVFNEFKFRVQNPQLLNLDEFYNIEKDFFQQGIKGDRKKNTAIGKRNIGGVDVLETVDTKQFTPEQAYSEAKGSFVSQPKWGGIIASEYLPSYLTGPGADSFVKTALQNAKIEIPKDEDPASFMQRPDVQQALIVQGGANALLARQNPQVDRSVSQISKSGDKEGDIAWDVSEISPSNFVLGFSNSATGNTAENRNITTDFAVTHTPTKVSTTTNASMVNMENNEPIDKPQVRDVEYGQMMVVPVYKTGPKRGKIIPPSFMANPDPAIANALKNDVQYKVYSFGSYDENDDQAKTGVIQIGGNKKRISVYQPTDQVLGAIRSKGNKEYRSRLLGQYDELRKQAEILNGARISGATSPVIPGTAR